MGLVWNPSEDAFKFQSSQFIQEENYTKRSILSFISRLFEPLGLFCPFITRAKILLQKLWLLSLDWDEPVPLNFKEQWTAMASGLASVNSLSIPRYVEASRDIQCQVHGFADASSRSYGCCLYLRVVNGSKVSVHLLTARSRVAPLKTKTIARLWSDSEVVLHWHITDTFIEIGNIC